MAEKTGRFYRQKVELPYGLVFGLNEGENEHLKKSNLADLISFHQQDDKKCTISCNMMEGAKYNALHLTQSQYKAIDLLVDTLNKVENVLMTYHNGNVDGGCDFNGQHWHIMANLRIHPTADARWGKEISAMGRATKEVYLKAQIANSVAGLSKHICKDPRVYIGSKGSYGPMWEEYKKTRDSAENDKDHISPDWTGAKLKEDHNHSRITNLCKLMQKYKTPDQGTLKQMLLTTNGAEWETYVQLMCLPSWDTVSKKAAELYKTEDQTMTFSERFAKPLSTFDGETEKYYSTEKSRELLAKWFDWQGINSMKFIAELKAVLSRFCPKVNTFAVVGEASSGKSYVVRSLLPYYSYYGEAHGMEGNYVFMWQGLVDCPIAVMEECSIYQNMVEQAKQIFEGQKTMVKVKCKADTWLTPLPILITSNNNPWHYCSGSRQALEDRMFHYTTKRAPWLRDHHKAINPNIWYQLFQDSRCTPNKGLTQQEIDYLTTACSVDDIVGNTQTEQEEIYLDPRESAQKEISKDEYLEIMTQMSPLKPYEPKTPDNSQDLFEAIPETPPSKMKKRKVTQVEVSDSPTTPEREAMEKYFKRMRAAKLSCKKHSVF